MKKISDGRFEGGAAAKSRMSSLAVCRLPSSIFLLIFVSVVCFQGISLAYAATPTLGTVSPSSGSIPPDTATSFVCKYSDASGWAHLKEANLLIGSPPASPVNSPYLYYDQNLNQLFLRNEANTAWLGGFAPGSEKIIENSLIKLNCARTAVSGSGTTMTVTFNVTFKVGYSGRRCNLYLAAKDDAGISVSFTSKGTYSINRAPILGVITPSFGSSIPNQPFSITTGYQDPDGWANLGSAYLLINTSTGKTNCLYAYYNQNTNKLYLRNDADSAWVGGYAPGSNNAIENSYVKLNCTTTTATGSGTDLTVKWSVIFKSAFLGAKNTYLSVTDDVNVSTALTQKGTWTALDSGTAIGPEGGQVLSSDGKVKLIVPSGALSALSALSIATVPKETLQSAVPQGTDMINAVDCKPYGLVFNQSVSIVYTLDQAEIPGTPVELGLYDSVLKKINPTGQKSVISSDGYSVTFSLQHYSTYAALMNLVPQGAPIGGGVKIPLPDMLTGSFGHSIPITIPPGRRGMQPALRLSYHSGSVNSWVGLGFSLNSGYIVRSTRLGPPSFNDSTDTFYLITDAGTTELVHLIDNLYQAKIESSFTKFYKDTDDSWRVVAKDGSVLKFGQTPDAKETATPGTFSWYLTRAQDVNGNYVQYSYIKDQGKSYLARIDYTGHESGVLPTNSVEFILENRDDATSSYISTSKITTAKRLKEIQVKLNSGLVWRYVLEYTSSQDTNRSLLTSVTQFSSDNKNLPVQRLTYQKSS